MTEHGAMASINTDTKYLGVNGYPLTQAAIEQLERACLGRQLGDVNWIARVVITHGVGDERYAHDVAIGKERIRPPSGTGTITYELVAMRISEVQDDDLRLLLRNKPLALLMF